jgi:hypothetical protein
MWARLDDTVVYTFLIAMAILLMDAAVFVDVIRETSRQSL